MRKTLEIEYVGIEDLQEILDDVYAVVKDGNHVYYSSMSVNDTIITEVYIMVGGWKADKEYDFKFTFRMTDEAEDVQRMNECKCVLKNLLVED